MLDFRHFLKYLKRCHKVRHRCLVIGTQHRCPVAYDDVLTYVVPELRMFCLPDEELLLLILADIAARIFSYDLCMDLR